MSNLESLIEELNTASYNYYNGLPLLMSDEEYDKKYDELKEIEKSTGIILSNSPTQKIGASILPNLNKITITDRPMLSLDKCHTIEELEKFSKNQLMYATCKCDGLSVRIIYENGKIVSANTRGNGFEGQDITEHIKHFLNVPLIIPTRDRVIVDGEAIILIKDFEEINVNKEFKNPRNLAAGTLASLDTSLCTSRRMRFIAWDLIQYGDIQFEEYNEKFDILYDLGFEFVIGDLATKEDFDYTNNLLRTRAAQYAEKGLPIDGIVWRFNDEKFDTTRTAKFFNNAIAFKFKDEEAISTLLDIEWSMGKTGVLTPVAIFEPVELEGTEVSRSSIHNINIMNDLAPNGWYKGSKVTIIKSNQIIPQIIKVEPPNFTDSDEILEPPLMCPICGKPTLIEDTGNSLVLVCKNPDCEGQLLNRIDHFVGKKGLDIKGLSKATISKLISWNWLNNIDDVFNLKEYRQEWIKKSGFGTASVDKILNKIEERRNDCELWQFISGLSIPLIGSTYAKQLAAYFKTWDNFLNAVNHHFDFSSLEGFGDEMHRSLTTYDYTIASKIASLLIFKENKEELSDECKGSTFCITGKLSHFKNRDELKALIEKCGGKVTGSVTTKTSFLINNDINSNSAKNVAAQRLNIPILTEEEFLNMVGK